MNPTWIPRFAVVCALIGLALSLSACGPSAGDANRQAREFCAGHGGVEKIEYYPAEWPTIASFDADCRDGSEYE